MTLNMTLLTPAAIYQSSDFRLTDPNSQKVIRDESVKTVILRYQRFSGFVTYTGVGAWGNIDISTMIVNWLGSAKANSLAEVATILETEGTRLLNKVRRATRKRFPHTFTLAGFEDQRVRAYVISNFEDCFGRTTHPAAATLSTTKRELRKGSSPVVIVTGQPSSVPSATRRSLCQLAIRKPDDGGLIRTHMQSINAVAASTRAACGAVSQDSAVISFRSDGLGLIQLSEDRISGPKSIPVVIDGIDERRLLLEAMASIGLDFTEARLQNSTFATIPPLGPIAEVPSTCRFSVIRPTVSAGYDVEEIQSAEFDTLSANDINDEVQVVGTGRLERTTPWRTSVPWTFSDSAVFNLGFQGSAISINNQGGVSINVNQPGSCAGQLTGNTLNIFQLTGRAIEEVDATSSNAVANNIYGYVTGSVCTQSGNNKRAALFHASHEPLVLIEPGARFGTQAVDINDEGQVVVIGSFAPSVVRTIIWDPTKDDWRFIDYGKEGVRAVSINNQGAIVGYAAGTAVIYEPGSSWRELGTEHGWYPKDVNDSGDTVGIVSQNGYLRPWLRLASGEIILLPFVDRHNTEALAINNNRDVVGGAHADHGGHALIWRHP